MPQPMPQPVPEPCPNRARTGARTVLERTSWPIRSHPPMVRIRLSVHRCHERQEACPLYDSKKTWLTWRFLPWPRQPTVGPRGFSTPSEALRHLGPSASDVGLRGHPPMTVRGSRLWRADRALHKSWLGLRRRVWPYTARYTKANTTREPQDTLEAAMLNQTASFRSSTISCSRGCYSCRLGDY